MLHTTEYDNRDHRTTEITQAISIDPVEIFTNCLANNSEYYGPIEGILNALFAAGCYTLVTEMCDAAEYDIDEEKLTFDIERCEALYNEAECLAEVESAIEYGGYGECTRDQVLKAMGEYYEAQKKLDNDLDPINRAIRFVTLKPENWIYRF